MNSNYLILIWVLLFLGNNAAAQDDQPNSGETKGWKRGIIVGAGRSKLIIKESNWRQTNYKDSLNSIKSEGRLSTYLGIILQYQFNQQWGIRTNPMVTFEGGRIILERKQTVETIKKDLMFFDLPAYLAFSKPIGAKTSFYFLAGPNLRFGLGKNEETDAKVTTEKFVLAGNAGFGFSFKMKDFLLCPELIYTQGFNNIKTPANNLFGNVVSSVKTQGVYLTLLFRSM